MKKALFFALVSLLLPMELSRPAYARDVHVSNLMGEPIVVNVIYYTHLCRDDKNKRIAAGGRFSVGAGICSVKEVNAVIVNAQGTHVKACKSWHNTQYQNDRDTSFKVSGNSSSCIVSP